jgi:hypothetical protein
MKNFVTTALLTVALSGAALAPASAQQWAPYLGPFTPDFDSRLSNIAPLEFGMEPQDVEQALGTQLYYIKGPPGGEVLMAIRSVGSNVLFLHKDRLYLQFRRGRLTGWKGDWGHSWMWQ